MNTVVLIKRISIFLLITAFAFACRKKYAYDFEDGFPNDGASTPSVTVDTNIKNIDVSKYAQARIFPGLVCSTEPRLTVQLAMDLNYNFVEDDLRISVPPQPQFSTGLYAAPGELVIIDVPFGDYSLSVQVGAWTDNLSSIQNPPRDPVIYLKSQLAPGRNYIRNLYGGHIYIYAGRPITTPVNLVFTNVLKSPDFILGQTSNEEWQAAIRNSCVPFLELRSKNMIFVVPREYCVTKPIADPTALMTEWDNAINLDFYKWEGLEENPVEDIDRAPLLPWRIVQDIRPVVGYGHSGFPIVTFNDFGWFDEFTNINQIRGGGCWGTFHELGHNNQQTRYWSWSTLGETTCNLFSFKVAHRQEAISPTAWPPSHPALPDMFPKALAFALDGNAAKNFDGADPRINDPFARLTPFIQIFDKVPAGMNYDGWGFMTELYKKARRATRISLSDQDKRDFVYETLCDYTQKDWIFFFKAWGINISNISSGKMAAKYPVMNQKIWEYNPLTRTGGNTTFNPDPFDKTNWTVSSFSSQEAGGEGPVNGYASAIIDGDVNTFWHSQWSGGTGTAPHRLVVDMGRSLSIHGFVFSQRQSLTRNIKNLKVETSNDGITWTAVAGSPFSLAQIKNPQTRGLPASISCRFFRMEITSNSDVYDGSTFAALGEVDVLKEPDPYFKGNWAITASSQEAGGEGPVNGYAAAAIDGKDNTFWHSQWSGGTGMPPHILTIDMGKSLPIDGFVITQRQSLSRNIKNMVIETSPDGITWSAVAGSPFTLTQTAPPQAKLLPGEITTRYFRLKVESNADVFDGSNNAALAEVNVSHR